MQSTTELLHRAHGRESPYHHGDDTQVAVGVLWPRQMEGPQADVTVRPGSLPRILPN